MYYILQYFIQLSNIISENLVGNTDLGGSCPDQTFFELLLHLYFILQYFIQLSDIISENLVGNPDLGASCPDQTFLLCCNCSSASTVPLHKQPASSSSSSSFGEDFLKEKIKMYIILNESKDTFCYIGSIVNWMRPEDTLETNCSIQVDVSCWDRTGVPTPSHTFQSNITLSCQHTYVHYHHYHFILSVWSLLSKRNKTVSCYVCAWVNQVQQTG